MEADGVAANSPMIPADVAKFGQNGGGRIATRSVSSIPTRYRERDELSGVGVLISGEPRRHTGAGTPFTHVVAYFWWLDSASAWTCRFARTSCTDSERPVELESVSNHANS